MAVDEQRGKPWTPGTLAPDHGMSRSFDDLHRRTAQSLQMISQPVGCPPAVGGMGGQGADTGNEQKLTQFPKHSLLLPAYEVGVHRLLADKGRDLSAKLQTRRAGAKGEL